MKITKWVKTILAVMLLVICIFPLYWTFNYSFLPEVETIVYPPHYLPSLHLATLTAYFKAFAEHPMAIALINSIGIVLAASFVTIFLSFPAAYALSKFDFKLRIPIYYGIILLLGIPWIVYVLPLFNMVVKLGLYDTHVLMIMLYGFSGVPLFTWIALPFIRAFPNDIIESARIDGCSQFTILFRIIMPVMKSTVFTLLILRFIWAYNDLLYQLVFTLDRTKMIIPTILEFPGLYTTPYALMAAGGIIAIIPVLMITIIFQRYIVRGLTGGISV